MPPSAETDHHTLRKPVAVTFAVFLVVSLVTAWVAFGFSFFDFAQRERGVHLHLRLLLPDRDGGVGQYDVGKLYHGQVSASGTY